MILGGLLTMSGGLFLEQTSPPTISSLGLILVLAGIVVLARDVKPDGTREEQESEGKKED